MPQYPCIESTVDIEFNGRTVRLWINETSIHHNDMQSTEALHKLSMFIGGAINRTDAEIIEFVSTFPNINAVQIRRNVFGTVVYFVDFAEVK